MPTYKLIYFNGRGRGEIIRLIFAFADQKYEDCRLERDQWPEHKPSSPFGQLPILEIDGVKYCQSNACARYLARQFGLAGKTELDQARVDMLVECMEDTTKPLLTLFFEPDETKKAALKKKYLEEDLPKFLGYFDALLAANKGGDGYLVGDAPTWADLAFLNMVGWIGMGGGNLDGHPKLAALHKRVEALPKVKAWLDKRPVTQF